MIKGRGIEMLQTIINYLIGMCGVLTFLACYVEPIQSRVKAVTTSILLERMKVAKSRYFNYDRLDMFIKAHGVSYMMSESINPVSYTIMKLVVGTFLASVVVIETSHILMFPVFFILGFFGVDLLVKKNNEKNNEKMLMDISNIYDVLKIQLKAGVFITTSIFFCYKNCKNKRLKDGLLLLYLDIQTSSNISEALRRFDARFKNANLSTLCAVLEQSLITGQLVTVLDNISKKNVGIQRLANEQYKKNIEKKYHRLSILMVLGIFAGIYWIMMRDFSNMFAQF